MLQSIFAVYSLAIQRSLTILEDRYRELRQIGEKRFGAWDTEKAELKGREGELATLKAQR